MEDKDLEKSQAAEKMAEQPEQQKKTLTPEEMEKRRKFIVIPVFVLVFLGVMY